MFPYRCIYNVIPICRLRKEVFNTLDYISIKESGGVTVVFIDYFFPFQKMLIRIKSCDILIELVRRFKTGGCGLRKSNSEVFIDTRPRDFPCDKLVSKLEVVKSKERTPSLRQ